jgi:hypothetical protein
MILTEGELNKLPFLKLINIEGVSFIMAEKKVIIQGEGTQDYKALYEQALKEAEAAKKEAEEAKAFAAEQLEKTKAAQMNNEDVTDSVEAWLEQRVPVMLF